MNRYGRRLLCIVDKWVTNALYCRQHFFSFSNLHSTRTTIGIRHRKPAPASHSRALSRCRLVQLPPETSEAEEPKTAICKSFNRGTRLQNVDVLHNEPPQHAQNTRTHASENSWVSTKMFGVQCNSFYVDWK